MGFSPDTLQFLAELRANNTRDWFAQNKQRYERNVKQPTQDFAEHFAKFMQERHQSAMRARVFRLHRDIRFSKDKTPFNTHVHLACMDVATGAAWMVGLEPVERANGQTGDASPTGRLHLGYGCLVFSKPRLEAWRAGVAGAGAADLEQALSEAAERLTAGLSLRINDPSLKRVPAGFDPSDPGGAWLRRKAFCVWIEGLSVDLAMGESALDAITKSVTDLEPLRAWWLTTMGPAA